MKKEKIRRILSVVAVVLLIISIVLMAFLPVFVDRGEKRKASAVNPNVYKVNVNLLQGRNLIFGSRYRFYAVGFPMTFDPAFVGSSVVLHRSHIQDYLASVNCSMINKIHVSVAYSFTSGDYGFPAYSGTVTSGISLIPGVDYLSPAETFDNSHSISFDWEISDLDIPVSSLRDFVYIWLARDDSLQNKPVIINTMCFVVNDLYRIYYFSSASSLALVEDESHSAGYNEGYGMGYNLGQSEQLKNPVIFFLDPVDKFMNVKLFGSISLGSVFRVALSVMVMLLFLKMFSGG